MFDYKLMTESADEIEIMEYSADFDYNMRIHEIAYMESGDEEVFTEGVIETAKDYIMKIYTKIRRAIADAKAKINEKITDIKVKAAIKKWKSLSLKERENLNDPDVKMAHMPKIKNSLDEYGKLIFDYYKWVQSFDITEGNVDEFIEKDEKWDDKFEEFEDNLNIDEYVFYTTVADYFKHDNLVNDMVDNKWSKAFEMTANQLEKEAKNSVEKIARQGSGTEGQASISKKTASITKRAAKTAGYYTTMTGLIMTSTLSFVTAIVTHKVVKFAKSVDRAFGEENSYGVGKLVTAGSAAVGVGTAASAVALHKQHVSNKKKGD